MFTRNCLADQRHSVACVLFVFMVLLSTRLQAQQQTLTFDWASRPKNVGQSVSAPSLELGAPENVEFRITGINDIFYAYALTCVGTPKEAPDLTDFFNLIAGKQLEAAPLQCDTDAATLVKNVIDYLKGPDTCGTNCDSQPLKDTILQLQTFDGQISKLNTRSCSASSKDALEAAHKELQQLIAGLPHSASFTQTISPTEDYVCTVTESRNGRPTNGGALSIALTPTNEILTLSLGPMFSAVQNRTYSAITIPNSSSASGTSTVLGVQGKAFSANIAALVNVRLPIYAFSHPSWGIDASAGPVVRLNSSSGTSSAGFFAGLSLRLYRYVFITPGIHVGSFADFPQGFSAAGQVIPSNFPTPQAVTRNTAKFGIGITFQAKDFKSLGKSTATTVTPSPSSTPKNAPSNPNQNSQTSPQEQSLSVTPTTLDFGQLAATEITKTIDVKNDTSSNVQLIFDPQDASGQVSFSHDDLVKCSNIASKGTCSIHVTVKPGSAHPNTVLNIRSKAGHSLPSVKITWAN